ncbi:MFS transporter small subunit [Salinisphaera aquimarina]|uniref:Oxalate:formate antiporter n=1 Tax=Salinisphaera aquimarina TaxID=2094031 RepID=A0ABV7EQC1_9GAMM
MTTDSSAVAKTPTWQIAALWAMVTIPALWGFIETLVKALRLFTG